MNTKLFSTILVATCFLSCSNDEDFTNQNAVTQTQTVSDEQAYEIFEKFLTRDSNGLFKINISQEGASIYNISPSTYIEAVNQIETLNLHLSKHPQYAAFHPTPFYHTQQKMTRSSTFVYWDVNVRRSDASMSTGTIGIPPGFVGGTDIPLKKCRRLYLYLKGNGRITLGVAKNNYEYYYLGREQETEIDLYTDGIIGILEISNQAGPVTGTFFAYTRDGVIQTQ